MSEEDCPIDTENVKFVWRTLVLVLGTLTALAFPESFLLTKQQINALRGTTLLVGAEAQDFAGGYACMLIAYSVDIPRRMWNAHACTGPVEISFFPAVRTIKRPVWATIYISSGLGEKWSS